MIGGGRYAKTFPEFSVRGYGTEISSGTLESIRLDYEKRSLNLTPVCVVSVLFRLVPSRPPSRDFDQIDHRLGTSPSPKSGLRDRDGTREGRTPDPPVDTREGSQGGCLEKKEVLSKDKDYWFLETLLLIVLNF